MKPTVMGSSLASASSSSTSRFHREVLDLLSWVQCFGVYIAVVASNSSNSNVEYRDGIRSRGDKIRMPCTHITVI